VNATRPGAAWVAAALVVLGAVALLAPTGPAPDPSPRPSAPPSPTVADPLRVPFSDRFEPFDYEDAPPLERTPLDGSYLRIVTLDELGGPVAGIPTHCRRCVPFEIDPGLETLTLYRGRYFLEHQLTGRRGLGHYVVDGDEVRFFNDPNCSHTTGVYRWRLLGRTLSLEGVSDPCPFGEDETSLDHRARDLTFSDWTKVRVCTAQIRIWWPALFSCAA
jgi:hypothetical protein